MHPEQQLGRLQGLDWRDPEAAGCNANYNPIQEGFYDGIDVNPLEVLFVKVRRRCLGACLTAGMQGRSHAGAQLPAA